MRHVSWLLRCLSVVGLFASISMPAGNVRAADVQDELQQRQVQLTNALKKVREAVVGVSDGMGVGSGVIVTADGIVLTASHVVTTRNRRSRNELATITMADGRQLAATVLGKDRDSDAAVLRINALPDDKSSFPYAEMGRVSESKVGEYCFAMGHPGGYRLEREAPVRFGRILSIGNRTVVSDCAILLGDSGGPLFSLDGKVIGIHSMITSLIIENRHVSIDSFHHDWDRLLAGDRWGHLRSTDNDLVQSGFFGVHLTWKDFTPIIADVIPDTPAEKAGLKPGDVLLTVEKNKIADRLDLSTTLDLLEEDQEIEIGILRDGKETSLALVTGDDTEDMESSDDEDGPQPESNHAEDPDREQEIIDQLSENRAIGTFEKRSSLELGQFSTAVKPNLNSIVSIRDGGLLMCLGTVMSTDGYILTKASELHGAIDPEVILPSGRRFKAQELASDYAFDLMLLKVDATDLQPVSLMREAANVGDLAVLQNGKGEALIPTVISVKTHSMEGANKAFMGIRMAEDDNGVRIERILPGGAAQRNGMKPGDVIMSLNGRTVDRMMTLIDAIGGFKPGDKISVRFMREDKIRTIDILLTSKFVNDDTMLPLYRDQQFEGQFASTHAGGFPQAIQIDADVYPRQVGGPLLGLNGKALGIVIARADRFPAFAIPADAVATVFEQLKIEAKNKANP